MKKITFTAIIVVMSFIGGIIFTRTYQYYKFDRPLLQEETAEYSKYILLGSDLPYYKKTKKEILEILPKPDFDDTIKIVNDSIFAFSKWYRDYWFKLCLSKDSVKYVNRLGWNNMPDKNKPILVIIFEEENGNWIADYCIQWHPDKIYTD